MVCANLSFDSGAGNPIASALPDVVCLPLAAIDGAEPVLGLLFEEAFEQRCGRVALVERLFEVVMIQVLRQLMENGEVHGGLLSGLSHPRLRNALVAMHEAPAQDGTLDELANVAGMSRSVFVTVPRDGRHYAWAVSTRLAHATGAEGLAARALVEGDRDRSWPRQRSRALARVQGANGAITPAVESQSSAVTEAWRRQYRRALRAFDQLSQRQK